MEREDRYIVIKRSDLEAAQAAGHVGHIEIAALNHVDVCADRMRFERNKSPLKCVVVESDWPEYEAVWKMIEARVDGTAAPQSHGSAIKAIEWSEEKQPCEDCRYNHVTGKTGLGEFSIEWKGWKDYDSRVVYLNGEYVGSGWDLDEAKQIAATHLAQLIGSCLQNESD